MRRRRPLWIVLGIAAILRGGFCLAVWSLERVQLAEITRRTEALKAEFDTRDYYRPVLRETPEAGNAWDFYLPALFKFDDEDKFANAYVHILSDYIHEKPKADRVQVEEIFAKHGTILDELRLGTRRTYTRFPYDWSINHILPGVEFGDPRFRYDWKTDWDHRNPHLQHQAIYLLSRARAKWLREQGRSTEAAELLLDLLLFERDRNLNDFDFSSGHASGLEDELRILLTCDQLSQPELLRVSRELKVLVDHAPDQIPSFRNSILKQGMDFREEMRAGREMRTVFSNDVEVTAGWRDLHSYRLFHARAFRLMDRLTESLAEGASLSWNEARAVRQKVFEEEMRERERGDRLDALILVPHLDRSGSARQRLLWVAAHYLATGEVLSVPDPFGDGPLKFAAGPTLRFWSVGADGTDHQGRGVWRGYWNQDLVLEVTR